MHQFTNSKCPVCGKTFTDSDDIVVCPECGTPHHRECYAKNGKCFNDDRHGSFEWAPAAAAATAVHHSSGSFSQPSESGKCPACGADNEPGSHYCKVCGAPLAERSGDSLERNFALERERVYSETFNGESFDGITAEEAVEAIGPNTHYFLPRFKAFSNGAKIIPNLCAFLLTYFYVLYRKMYGLGFLLMGVSLVLSIPQFLLDFQEMQEMYMEYGMLSQYIYSIPNIDTVTTYAVVASVIQWIVRVLLLLFFNKLYYVKTVATVKGIKEGLESANSYSDAMFHAFMEKKCGTNLAVPLIIVGVIVALSVAMSAYIITSPFFIMP